MNEAQPNSLSRDPGAPEPKKYTLQDTFSFSCHKGISCFTACCRDINIFLTPYDVLRMKRATQMTSDQFLNTYTIAVVDPKGFPAVVLKMTEDENKQCPFVSSEGCQIYQDRPWSCRIYPLMPAPFMEHEFTLIEEPKCHGLKEQKEWTIEEWRRSQGIELYDSMNESYKDITMHNYVLNKKTTLAPEEAKLLYMACYDLDKFRRFLFESSFFDKFDVPGETIAKMASYEEHLLDFAYKWIRFSLFKDPILRVNPAVLEAKKKAAGSE